MSTSVLAARLCARRIVQGSTNFPRLNRRLNTCRQISCMYLPLSPNIRIVQNGITTSGKEIIRWNTIQFRRHSNMSKAERRQSLIKRGFIFLAAFFLLHFLVVYVRYKNKRKGKSHKIPLYSVETIEDPDLKRKFSVINGYLLPDFVNAKTYDDIFNFKVHPDDIYVISFPKSGNSLLHRIQSFVKNLAEYNKRGPPSSTPTSTGSCLHVRAHAVLLYRNDLGAGDSIPH